jgi:hypothetical protein
VGDGQFERGKFSAHFVKMDLRFCVYVVIDKLRNVRRAQLLCDRLISFDYVEDFFCETQLLRSLFYIPI